jgi:phosphoribosylanthranilate isomerase
VAQTWIKLCGLKRAEEFNAAKTLGIDAVGVVFYPPSSRAITVEELEGLVPSDMGETQVVGLFVNPSRAEVDAALASRHITMLQFHGQESEAFCASFGVPYLKAIGIPDGTDAAPIDIEAQFDHYASARLILLDAFDAREHGGTGRRFDWTQAAALSDSAKRRLVLAGGLTPDNVSDAIHRVQPFGVDVSSGIEGEKGVKDIELMHRFTQGVRSA